MEPSTFSSIFVRHRLTKSSLFPVLFGAISFLLIFLVTLVHYHHTSFQTHDTSPIFLLSSHDQRSSSSSKQPHQHVYYMKTHKTGSTTMFSILAEYCRAHDLLPLLPRFSASHINQKPPFQSFQLSLVKQIRKYDMIFNHHIFDPRVFTFLHGDTFTLTTLREPFDNFISAFLYYREKWSVPYLIKVEGEDPVTEFLKNPWIYETKIYRSYTNNRQSIDLGYNASYGFTNIDYIKSFIHRTEKRFDLVLITEYFDESLIILKRFLSWETRDILYLSKNKGTYYKDETRDPEKEKMQRQLHANFSQADIMLYSHFLFLFKQKMEKEIGLKEEVEEFREILEKLREYCQYFNDRMSKSLVVPAGKWTNGFYVSPYKCKWLGLKETQVTQFLQGRQRTMFQNVV